MEKVILTKCGSYEQEEIREKVKKTLALLGGIEAFVKPGSKVLVKPNLFGAFAPEKAATTHPSIVREVCRLAKQAGGKVFIAESPCPARESFEARARTSGLLDVAQELDVPIFELIDPVRIDTPEGCSNKRMEFSRTALEADTIINIAKLKSHTQQMYTCGVKNMFGCVVGTRKPEWHANLDQDKIAFASMLLDCYLSLKPALTIVDAVWGMDGEGPAGGNPKFIGVLGASRNALLLDIALFARVNGNFEKLPLYQAAKRRKLIDDGALNKIEVTGDGGGVLIKDFVFPDLGYALYAQGMIGRLMKRYSIARPVGVPKNCIACRNCEKICPKAAVKIGKGKISFDYEKCIRCYCCQEICPAKAISFKKPLLHTIINVTKLLKQ